MMLKHRLETHREHDGSSNRDRLLVVQTLIRPRNRLADRVVTCHMSQSRLQLAGCLCEAQ
ncbi:hypothetical protein BO83DRAFT_374783 [Aspergillus eucalypticola CBS 122712]|uniref:Uncharacterized protein n=1 Tax=Aspergillus eucalypticola (strain CBS 122712 / IBT 29274) TaxID=1448314 RepID=A0A317WJS1_ASPEC|nr:uncharacterized protein BO83DRAFT_374783 [Aspergillus eucalypticola CBS 122712]PWY84460.1 hypothetical protein BO83DRAFT_374783 [Aspergillus eucalypticola CBS 122712]